MSNRSTRIPQIAREGELLTTTEKGGMSKKASRETHKIKNACISPAQWKTCIGKIASGVSTSMAVRESGIKKASLEGFLRTNPKMKDQWEDAKTAALWVNWDLEMLENIMVSIAMGGTVASALGEHCFEAGRAHAMSFYKLLMRDAAVKEMYDEARQIQAEKMAIDDLIEIADDDSGDETADGKPNSAAVNRARVKVDTRKWVAARMHYKRFGDKQQVDLEANIVVDHAARLEEARKRKEKANEQAKQEK